MSRVPTITASTPARSSSATSSRVVTRRSAIASFPAGTSSRRSSTRCERLLALPVTARREEKDLRIEPLERGLELVRLGDVDDALQASFAELGVATLHLTVFVLVEVCGIDHTPVRLADSSSSRSLPDDRQPGCVADAYHLSRHEEALGPVRLGGACGVEVVDGSDQ